MRKSRRGERLSGSFLFEIVSIVLTRLGGCGGRFTSVGGTAIISAVITTHTTFPGAQSGWTDLLKTPLVDREGSRVTPETILTVGTGVLTTLAATPMDTWLKAPKEVRAWPGRIAVAFGSPIESPDGHPINLAVLTPITSSASEIRLFHMRHPADVRGREPHFQLASVSREGEGKWALARLSTGGRQPLSPWDQDFNRHVVRLTMGAIFLSNAAKHNAERGIVSDYEVATTRWTPQSVDYQRLDLLKNDASTYLDHVVPSEVEMMPRQAEIEGMYAGGGVATLRVPPRAARSTPATVFQAPSFGQHVPGSVGPSPEELIKAAFLAARTRYHTWLTYGSTHGEL